MSLILLEPASYWLLAMGMDIFLISEALRNNLTKTENWKRCVTAGAVMPTRDAPTFCKGFDQLFV